MDESNPFERVTDHWEQVMADMEATAADYRDGNWRTIELHPGDVTTFVDSDEFGLDVLVPGDEFETLANALDEGVSVDSYQVFQGEGSDVVYLLLALEDEANNVVILCPAYYDVQDGEALLERAAEEDVLYTRIHTLARDNRVTFTHQDPTPFLS